MISDNVLVVIFWLLAAVVFSYLPVSLFLYWVIKVRNGRAQQLNLIREREISGFFGRRPALHWSGWSFIWPMIFATVVTIIGFMLAFPAMAGLVQGVGVDVTVTGGESPIPAALRSISRPLFFSVLGAFLFALQKVIRRFNANDLNPAAYFQIASRMIVAVIVAAIFSLAFTIQPAAALTGDLLTRVIDVLSFVVGIFPENGFNWILSFARQYAPNWIAPNDSQNKLQHLEGMNYWHAMRLGVEGIDNVYNLANADIYDLVQRTQFPVQQIFDWVDQAVLFIHLQDEAEFKNVQALGVRGFNDFQLVFRNDNIRNSLQSSLNDGTRRLDVLYATMQQAPSSDPISLFWQYKSSYLTGAFDHFNRGRVFAELGDHDRAIDQFNLALSKNPLDPLLMVSKGFSERAKGASFRQVGNQVEAINRLQQAINDFSRAIELEPFLSEAYIGRAMTYRELSKYNSALDDLAHLLEFEKENLQARNQRAIVYQVMGDFARAIGELESIAERDVETKITLANAYRQQGEIEKAEQALNEAIQIDSARPEIYFTRARLYVQMGSFLAAYQDFDRALELGAGNQAEIYTEKGRAYFIEAETAPPSMSRDLYIKARAHLTLAIDSDQSYAPAYSLRGATYEKTNQLDQALEDYSAVIDVLDPTDGNSRINRGIIFARLGRLQEALFDFSKGLNANPELVIGYVNRGQVYEQLNRFEDAQLDYKRAIEIQDKQQADGSLTQLSAAPFINLGALLLRQEEDLDEAETALTRAIRIDSRAPEIFLNRGLVRVANGRFSSAIEDFSQATELAPTDPLYFYHLGAAYAEAGLFDEALSALDKALALQPDYGEAVTMREQVVQANPA